MHAFGNRERMDFRGALSVDTVVSDLLGLRPAHAGAHHDPETRALLVSDLETAALHGLARGDQAVLCETIHQIEAFLREKVSGAILGDLGGDLDAQRRGIELFDPPDGRPPFEEVCDEAFRILAGGGNYAETCDNHSAHFKPSERSELA